MKTISWKIKVDDLHSMQEPLNWLVKKLYILCFRPKGYVEYVHHSLTFGREFLVYTMNEATMWHISYERLSHLEIPKNSYCGLTMQHRCEVFFITNDNDQYTLPHNFTDNMINEIKSEIEKVKKI
jgi:hypothetical protein